MKKEGLFTWVMLAMFAVASPVLQGRAADANQNTSSHTFQKAGTLLGKDVMNTSNEKIGTIRNLVVDLESGRILYAVVGLGSGNHVAVPAQEFRVTKNGLISRAGKQKLESAPKFEKGVDFETGASAAFANQVYQHFGEQAWWSGAQGPTAGSFNNVHTVKSLPGTPVINVNNTPVGKVNNVVLDLSAGRVAYLTLDPNKDMASGNDLYALPPNALTLAADKKRLVTDLDKEKLNGAPHFAPDHWPGPNDMSFASRVYQHYGKQAWFEQGSGLQPTGRTEDQDNSSSETTDSQSSGNWWWQ